MKKTTLSLIVGLLIVSGCATTRGFETVTIMPAGRKAPGPFSVYKNSERKGVFEEVDQNPTDERTLYTMSRFIKDEALEEGQGNGRGLLITWKKNINNRYEWTSKEVNWDWKAEGRARPDKIKEIKGEECYWWLYSSKYLDKEVN